MIWKLSLLDWIFLEKSSVTVKMRNTWLTKVGSSAEKTSHTHTHTHTHTPTAQREKGRDNLVEGEVANSPKCIRGPKNIVKPADAGNFIHDWIILLFSKLPTFTLRDVCYSGGERKSWRTFWRAGFVDEAFGSHREVGGSWSFDRSHRWESKHLIHEIVLLDTWSAFC